MKIAVMLAIKITFNILFTSAFVYSTTLFLVPSFCLRSPPTLKWLCRETGNNYS